MKLPVLFLILISISCTSKTFVPQEVPDPLPAFYVPERIRVALVLGSGGVRGMAHVGAIEELEAAGIPVDLIVGCSAGSIVGALYADNPNAWEVGNIIWGLKKESIVEFNFLQCHFGFSRGCKMHKTLSDNLSCHTFEELKIPLVVVASDLYSGELVPMGSGDLVKAVQASSSIPMIFVPCEHMGRVMVDGGVIDPVPTRIAHELGAEIIIAVDLCEVLPLRFPTNLVEVGSRSADIASMWQNDLCCKHATITIRPRTCGIGTFNEKMKQELYEAGKKAAREKIPLIKKYLENLPPPSDKKKLVSLDCYCPEIMTSFE
jgi:NTE family protein